MLLLEQKGIHLAMDSHLTKQIIEADLELVQAILTYFIRYERFCNGLWLVCAREGYFLLLLQQLKYLLEE